MKLSTLTLLFSSIMLIPGLQAALVIYTTFEGAPANAAIITRVDRPPITEGRIVTLRINQKNYTIPSTCLKAVFNEPALSVDSLAIQQENLARMQHYANTYTGDQVQRILAPWVTALNKRIADLNQAQRIEIKRTTSLGGLAFTFPHIKNVTGSEIEISHKEGTKTFKVANLSVLEKNEFKQAFPELTFFGNYAGWGKLVYEKFNDGHLFFNGKSKSKIPLSALTTKDKELLTKKNPNARFEKDKFIFENGKRQIIFNGFIYDDFTLTFVNNKNVDILINNKITKQEPLDDILANQDLQQEIIKQLDYISFKDDTIHLTHKKSGSIIDIKLPQLTRESKLAILEKTPNARFEDNQFIQEDGVSKLIFNGSGYTDFDLERNRNQEIDIQSKDKHLYNAKTKDIPVAIIKKLKIKKEELIVEAKQKGRKYSEKTLESSTPCPPNTEVKATAKVFQVSVKEGGFLTKKITKRTTRTKETFSVKNFLIWKDPETGKEMKEFINHSTYTNNIYQYQGQEAIAFISCDTTNISDQDIVVFNSLDLDGTFTFTNMDKVKSTVQKFKGKVLDFNY